MRCDAIEICNAMTKLRDKKLGRERERDGDVPRGIHESTNQSKINELEDPAVPACSFPLVIARFAEM